jgi:hypothetical protein
MVAEYAGEADEVIVLVSPVGREGITADQSIALWSIYLEELPYDNIKVMRSPVNSPVLAAYQFVENPDDNPLWAQPGDEVIMGVSTKGGDEERFCKNVQKYAREGVLVRANCAIDPAGGSFTNQETGEPFSATNMRRAIANRNKDLLAFIPPEAHDRMDDIEDILMKEVRVPGADITAESIFKMIEEVIDEKDKKTDKKKKEPITLENLFDMVEEVIDEEEEKVEEISSMAGGSVAGYSLPLGAKPRKAKKKKRKGRRIYIPD